MFVLTEISEVVLALGTLLEVIDDAGNRKHHGFLKTLLEATLFWGWKL